MRTCVSTSDYLLVYNTILNLISAGSHAEGRATQCGKSTEEGRHRYDIFEKCHLKAS